VLRFADKTILKHTVEHEVLARFKLIDVFTVG